MKFVKAQLDYLLILAGLLFLFWVLFLPDFKDMERYEDTLRYASSTLRGNITRADIATNILGFRGLYRRTDPYPVLGPALRELGIEWDVPHASTHPPTAYLFVAPVAFLSWPLASAIWGWSMLCLMGVSLYLYGVAWKRAVGLTPFLLLWPPASFSLGQITIIWLLGIALAYRFRERPFLSGASVGFASLTKFTPALLLLYFILKKWKRVAAGFIIVWVVSLLIIFSLHPKALSIYLDVNRRNSAEIIHRGDNAALFLNAYRYGKTGGLALSSHGSIFGLAALGAVLLFLLALAFVNLKDFRRWTGRPPERVWFTLSYFAVALLPIFWLYSLLPLLPALIYLIRRGHRAVKVLALCALLANCFFPLVGPPSVAPIIGVTLLVGVALLLNPLLAHGKSEAEESAEFMIASELNVR